MKKFIATSILFAAFLGIFAVTAQAQAPRIAVIDLRKVFDEFYKTKQADTNLKQEAADMDGHRKEMVDTFRKGEEEYRDLLDQANDQAVSSQERERSKAAAERKLLELRELEESIGQFERTARAQLAEKQRRMRDRILNEIREAITAQARRSGFTLVLDTAAETVNNTPVILYTSGENDITETILTQLNAGAPPGLR